MHGAHSKPLSRRRPLSPVRTHMAPLLPRSRFHIFRCARARIQVTVQHQALDVLRKHGSIRAADVGAICGQGGMRRNVTERGAANVLCGVEENLVLDTVRTS